MNIVKLLAFNIMAILFIITTNVVFANDKASKDEIDAIFQALDMNKDGKISKEEWNAMDTNKDNYITHDEWQKYDFKSSRTIKWFDNNGDVLMDRDEFLKNFE
jgi:Ca2+-binding EF-hand superfamily protein